MATHMASERDQRIMGKVLKHDGTCLQTHGHFKYAYVVLLHLVKCICILPEKQAISVKWNRFFNGSGRQGANISLDLKKEQQNRGLKSIRRALGPNLDEAK